MLILGVDPGLERVGFGLIVREGSKLQAVEYGLIETPRIEIADRLTMLHDQMRELIERTQPDALAIERLVFAANRTTAFDVAKAIGVILLAGASLGKPWTEYAPPEIKQAVVGQGNADKRQVQFMVTKLLSLAKPPKPDDVSDALAIAICHAFRSRTALR